MITLTPKALVVVKRFLDSSTDPVAGLRISVAGGGCAGLQYRLKLEQERDADDFSLDCEGLTLLIDPFSAPLLEGTTVDFVESLSGSGFQFANPKAQNSCACGQSFAS